MVVVTGGLVVVGPSTVNTAEALTSCDAQTPWTVCAPGAAPAGTLAPTEPLLAGATTEASGDPSQLNAIVRHFAKPAQPMVN
ncbi:hypothetical protein [Amycolatopsis magusensis]|uniref:hypothetical protein n=1 Tax=Amycolatopsis magusensis TaxID=882444 RepID=UPI00378EC086